ncbi:Period circadian protein [Penicillium taxi]|uniref:Period circadian protein n=1 Tax=Penicillium taxi TaxID=168475 RepID=UPI002545780C|nr:Period circadian protein [Penicillium taxi]KAJ5907880.1 Period circadian protein [Penicillium taxi]
MFFKSTLVLAMMALGNIAIAAQTPGCLLGVIGNTANPDDMPTICGSKDIQSSISKQCGEKSVQYFANMCDAAGYKIEESSTTASSSTSITGFVTAMSTVTGSPVTATCHAGCTKTSTETASASSGSDSSSDSGSGTSSTETSSASSPSSTSFNGATTVKFSTSLLVAGIFVGAAALL